MELPFRFCVVILVTVVAILIVFQVILDRNISKQQRRWVTTVLAQSSYEPIETAQIEQLSEANPLRKLVEVTGICLVKVERDTTGKCKEVPKSVWFQDEKFGGLLGRYATFNTCSRRGWGSWCGTQAEYKIEAAGTCFVKIKGNTTARCQGKENDKWFQDPTLEGTLATLTTCMQRRWESFCGTKADYKIEGTFMNGDRVHNKEPLSYKGEQKKVGPGRTAYVPTNVPKGSIGTVVSIYPKLCVSFDGFANLHMAAVFPEQIERVLVGRDD
mmetsp:Transcript_116356/g.184043  ORF Transcript_116356/g.184043 Transcript_116356/m.184043 type:complete len:271 (+) Transcript_116356:17-829(+)